MLLRIEHIMYGMLVGKCKLYTHVNLFFVIFLLLQVCNAMLLSGGIHCSHQKPS